MDPLIAAYKGVTGKNSILAKSHFSSDGDGKADSNSRNLRNEGE